MVTRTRSMIVRALAACGLLLAGAQGARAQAREAVAVGDRVRITIPVFVAGRELAGPRSAPRVGTVVGIDTATLSVRLERGDDILVAPFSVVRTVEVSRGLQPFRVRTERGAVRGALVGGGVGGTVVALVQVVILAGSQIRDERCFTELIKCDSNDGFQAEPVLLGAAVGAAAGGVIGAALGTQARERWRRVPVRVLRSSAARAAVGVSLRM